MVVEAGEHDVVDAQTRVDGFSDGNVLLVEHPDAVERDENDGDTVVAESDGPRPEGIVDSFGGTVAAEKCYFVRFWFTMSCLMSRTGQSRPRRKTLVFAGARQKARQM